MKAPLFFFFVFISISITGQNKFFFDTAKIDATSKLIGRYPQYDKYQTYRNLNFIIEDPKTIKKIITTLTLGKKLENVLEDPGFRISIVQNFEEADSWTINPNLKSIVCDGGTYEFDINKLKEVAKKYPFDYKFDKISFKKRTDYEQYLLKQKSDSTYLFDYPPLFKYEGSFEIQFPHNKKFSSPKSISNYLRPIIEKIVAKDEFTISYKANEKNINDQTQFTMTITGSKKIFDELQIGNLKKADWTETVEEGWFFYRTK